MVHILSTLFRYPVSGNEAVKGNLYTWRVVFGSANLDFWCLSRWAVTRAKSHMSTSSGPAINMQGIRWNEGVMKNYSTHEVRTNNVRFMVWEFRNMYFGTLIPRKYILSKQVKNEKIDFRGKHLRSAPFRSQEERASDCLFQWWTQGSRVPIWTKKMWLQQIDFFSLTWRSSGRVALFLNKWVKSRANQGHHWNTRLS